VKKLVGGAHIILLVGVIPPGSLASKHAQPSGRRGVITELDQERGG
jgi:hypothetical protein